MNNITVSPEALRNASAELRKRAAEWISQAEGISTGECRKRMTGCGRIIEDYAALLEKVSAEYEEAGKNISGYAGELYEQI